MVSGAGKPARPSGHPTPWTPSISGSATTKPPEGNEKRPAVHNDYKLDKASCWLEMIQQAKLVARC